MRRRTTFRFHTSKFWPVRSPARQPLLRYDTSLSHSSEHDIEYLSAFTPGPWLTSYRTFRRREQKASFITARSTIQVDLLPPMRIKTGVSAGNLSTDLRQMTCSPIQLIAEGLRKRVASLHSDAHKRPGRRTSETVRRAHQHSPKRK